MKKPQQTSFKYPVERAEASYYPGSFYIKLNESAIKIVEGTGAEFEEPREVCVFLHEYSHLVQDMTSLFGAFRFFQRINALEDLKKLCEVSDDVLIPLSQFVEDGRVISTGHDSAYAQYLDLESFFEQRNTWESNINYKVRSHSIEYKRFSWLKDDGGHPITLERPTVTFETIDGCSPTIYFGSFEIHEAYSLAVEEVFNKNPDSNSRPFEYRVARRIIESKMGRVISPQKLIAICHWSLQSLSPGRLFFDLIDNLCSQNITTITSDEQFFDCCKRYVFLNTNYNKNREGILNAILKLYKSQSSVNQDNLFAQALDWYYKSVNRLLHLRVASSRSYFVA